MRKLTKVKISQIINSILIDVKLTQKEYDTDLIPLGLDSILFIQLIVELEEYYKCEIPEYYLHLTQMNTINKIYNILIKTMTRDKNAQISL